MSAVAGTPAFSRITMSGWLLAGALALAFLVPLVKAWTMATDLGHGWAAPLLIGYLYWERWDERPVITNRAEVRFGWWILAVTALLVLVPLRLWVTPFPIWPALVLVYISTVVALGLSGAYLLAGKSGFKWIGGPLLILAGTLPWPYQIDSGIIQPLREALATAAAELINLTGQPALASGTTVRFAGAWVGVDEACGGIRSLQASVMIALFFGEWLRFGWAKRVGLVLVGIGAALLGNFLRILFLAWRATSSEAAVHEAHDLAGWLALALSLVVTGVFAWWWSRELRAQPAAVAPRREVQSAKSVVATGAAVKWCVVVAVTLVAIEVGNYFWYAHGAAKRTSVPQWTVRLPSGHWSFKNSPLLDASREILRPDFYAAGTWQAGRDREAGAYYVEWHHGQSARFVPVWHNPTVCLPYSGCELVDSLGEFSVKWSGGEIPLQSYLFRRGSERFVVAFAVWDPLRGGPLVRPVATKTRWEWFKNQWLDVAEARKDQPGQLLAVMLMGPDDTRDLKVLIESLIVPAP